MLCVKCHKIEATVHFTPVFDGKTGETIWLCADCALACGLGGTLAQELQSQSMVGKKCEFCGQAASTRILYPGTEIYWCSGCGLEFGRVIMDLCQAERPDLIERTKEGCPSLAFGCKTRNRDLVWEEQLHRRAAQIIKERRTQDGPDEGS
jgi:protein-arginine kinase activator protein McsA